VGVAEQRQNVYENKGSAFWSAAGKLPPWNSGAKAGAGAPALQDRQRKTCRGSPSSGEKGLGWWDFKNSGNELKDLLETKEFIQN
jgi:hypothetical protein